MVLALITPAPSNFMKDFPGQNSINCDRIDAYAGPCLPAHGLQSYTPDLTTSGGTKPGLGTGGFIRGFYYEIFDQIYTFGEFRFGSAGFTTALGVYMVSLPFDANALYPVGSLPGESTVIGNGSLFDSSSVAGSQPLTTQLRTATYMQFCHRMNSGLVVREVRDTGIITWAASDGISWSGSYQRAA